MIELAGVAARLLQTVGLSFALGAWVVAELARDPVDERRTRVRSRVLVALCVSLVASAGTLAVQAASLAGGMGDGGAGSAVLAERVLLETRFGHVWLSRTALVVVAIALSLAARGVLGHRVASGAAAAALVIAPAAGHSAALEPAWPTLMAHGAHLVGAAVWFGALVPLRSSLMRQGRDAGALLSRFSRLATVCMALVVSGGVWLAVQHVDRWPALLGTDYGAWLCLKLGALGGVFLMAGRLRWRVLPALSQGEPVPAVTWRWLGIEIGAAVAIVVLATSLGQTIPARHDAIVWLWPFRISIDATWDEPWVPARVVGGAIIVAGGVVWSVWRRRTQACRRLDAVVAGVTAVVGVALAVHAMSVPAYPDTYRTPSVPYEATSVARGADLFAKHCTNCHGPSAHGDGPAAATLPLPPADLTEPHTALHTAGDIFWWLTHGKPPGVMPAIADRTSEDDRWDLINYLRTLSAGYQARLITDRIVAGRPWLAAIDFGYVDVAGTAGALRDSREREVVLLVFFGGSASPQRLAALARERKRLEAAQVRMLAIPLRGDVARDTGLPTITDGAADIAKAYALYRRTLTDADPRDARPFPDHMELLVDRYGYVRARWLPQDSAAWSDVDVLLREATRLKSEPQIKAPPDDHVH